MSDKPSLWRSTPLSIFPICLALLALALAWRGASSVLPLWPEIWSVVGEVFSTIAALTYLFFLASYLRKLLTRPGVLLQDIATPPARGALASIGMGMLLLAAVALPFGQVAVVIWWVGLLIQTIASSIGAWAITRDPPEKRQFSTFQFLTFVGPVVSVSTGVALGYSLLSLIILLATVLAFLVITAGILRGISRSPVPAPLRPSMTIFLAPTCLFAGGFALLDIAWAFEVFYWLSLIIAAGLAALTPWMIKGGWNPIWSAFTFPVAAFVQLQVMAQSLIGGNLIAGLLIGSLALGTVIVLVISLRVLRMWASGALAVKTGAGFA